VTALVFLCPSPLVSELLCRRFLGSSLLVSELLWRRSSFSAPRCSSRSSC